MELLDQKAHNAEEQQAPHVEHAAVEGGVGAHGAHHEHHGVQALLGNEDDLRQQLHREEHDQVHQDIAAQQGHQNGVPDHRIVGDEQGAHLNALEHEGADQDGGGGVAGNTQAQQGHQGAAGQAVVGSLRGDQALGHAGAQQLGVLGPALGLGVGDQGGRGAAHTGQDAHEGAQQGGAEHIDDLPLEVVEKAELDVVLDLQRIILAVGGVHASLTLLEHLGDGEQADEHGEELEAALHLALQELRDHAVFIVDGELVHHGYQHAQHTDPQAAEHLAPGQGGDDGEGEEDDEELLHGRELDGPAGQDGGEEGQHHQGDHAAHEGGGDADFQGAFSLAPQGHWVSVEGRTHRRRGAGNVDEDGGDQAAGDAAHIEAQQQIEGHLHGVGVGQGEEHGHGHGGRHTGDGAEDDADDDAEQGHGDVLRADHEGQFKSHESHQPFFSRE